MTIFSTQASKVQTLSDFSKAVYLIQPWELSIINDPSLGAQEAFDRLLNNGWQPVDLAVPSFRENYSSSSMSSFSTLNKMEGGFYTYANAAAFVAQAGDSLVLSFRGTNDSNEKGGNDLDLSDQFHPDKDHWDAIDFGSSDSMTNHYGYFSSLFSQLDEYLDSNPDIKNLYVTGHSMGGAMAIEYMSRHPNSTIDLNLESVVFAAAPFTYTRNFFGFVHRKDYLDDARITQIEIAEDPVAESWDIGLDNNRPGNVIRLYGDQTMDTPDTTAGIYTNRLDNHSMSYYREMANGIDESAWNQILSQASSDQVVDVYLGGEQVGSEFIVSSKDDILKGEDFDFVFGGEGDDVLYANHNHLMNGGEGIDTLVVDGSYSQFWMSLNSSGESFMASNFSDQSFSFSSFERVQFSDTKLALDISGNAGMVAKALGAVFGADSIQNKVYMGIGLNFVDSGMDYETLMETALSAAGATNDEDVIDLLFSNILGVHPSANDLEYFESLLDNGMSHGDLGVLAADYVQNLSNIDFIGLAQSGIEFS